MRGRWEVWYNIGEFSNRETLTMTLAQENLILSLIGTEPDGLKPIIMPFRQRYCLSTLA